VGRLTVGACVDGAIDFTPCEGLKGFSECLVRGSVDVVMVNDIVKECRESLVGHNQHISDS